MDLSGTQPRTMGSAAPSSVLEYVERCLAPRWVPSVINLAALVLLSLGLAQATWHLLTPPAVDAKPTPGATTTNGDYDVQALLAASLFGRASAAAKPTQVALEAIPLSSLNLVLTGVMVTPAGSFAVISADGSPELPFAIGQEITAGVTLQAVYADRVLITRGGATESLLLKETSRGLPSGAVINPTFTASRSDSIVQRRGPRNFTVDRQQLTQQMQTPEFLTQALMVPNAGGGFLVREIQPGSVYEKLGLRVGDVITSVNGQAVNSVEDVMRLYAQFSTAANVQVDVRRAGRNETLVYNIQ